MDGNYFFHDLFELWIFHDETYKMMEKIREEVSLGILEFWCILFEILRTSFPIQSSSFIFSLNHLISFLDIFFPLISIRIFLFCNLSNLTESVRNNRLGHLWIPKIDHRWWEKSKLLEFRWNHIVWPNVSWKHKIIIFLLESNMSNQSDNKAWVYRLST